MRKTQIKSIFPPKSITLYDISQHSRRGKFKHKIQIFLDERYLLTSSIMLILRNIGQYRIMSKMDQLEISNAQNKSKSKMPQTNYVRQ